MSHTVFCSQLDNGVTVISQPTPGTKVTALGLWLVNGSRHQAEGQSGFAHLLEHLLFKGTPRHSAAQLANLFEQYGGHVNAHTGRELMALYGQVPAPHVFPLLELFSDMLLQPRISQRDLDVEKEVVLQEMAMVRDDPEEVLEESAMEHFFCGDPMGWPILGTEYSIQSVTLDDVMDYHQSVISGKRIVVVATGHIDQRQLVDQCATLAHASTGTRRQPQSPDLCRENFSMTYPSSQSCLLWTMTAPTLWQEGYAAALVANHILGGGTSSRLFQEVREQRGLVYGVHSMTECYSDINLWSIQTACVPENHEVCFDAVERVTENLIYKGPSEDEILIAKSYLKSNLVLDQHHLENALEHLAREYLYCGDIFSVEDKIRQIDLVRRDEIIALLADAWAQRSCAVLKSERE
jgi:predicted Zn-dependent peptidase